MNDAPTGKQAQHLNDARASAMGATADINNTLNGRAHMATPLMLAEISRRLRAADRAIQAAMKENP